jgi:hypothetical protein
LLVFGQRITQAASQNGQAIFGIDGGVKSLTTLGQIVGHARKDTAFNLPWCLAFADRLFICGQAHRFCLVFIFLSLCLAGQPHIRVDAGIDFTLFK